MKNAKVTMRDRLLNALKRQWLTPLSAIDAAGCMSLSQRCGEFRRTGLVVLDKWVKLPSGKKCKAYRIVKSC